MAGEVMDIGHSQARWLQDYQAKYPEYKVVVAFKSMKAEFGVSQVEEYKADGWKVLEKARHSDGVVVGLPWAEYNERIKAEKQLGQLPSARLVSQGVEIDQQVSAVKQRPMSRKQMEDEFGGVKQEPYVETVAEAPEE